MLKLKDSPGDKNFEPNSKRNTGSKSVLRFIRFMPNKAKMAAFQH